MRGCCTLTAVSYSCTEQTCSELLGKELSLLTIAFFYLGQMVRNFRGPLLELLQSGDIDLCFANEDEARELLR